MGVRADELTLRAGGMGDKSKGGCQSAQEVGGKEGG